MENITSLTTGAILHLMTGNDLPQPVLQLLGIRQINSQEERYRVILSDGKYFSTYAILKHTGDLNINTIVRLDKYSLLTAGNNINKHIIGITELTVLRHSDQVGKIGKPVDFENAYKEQIPPEMGEPVSLENSCREQTSVDESTTSHKSNQNLTRILDFPKTHSIDSLTPYQNNQNIWIKARVTSKTLWKNSKGFNIVLKDKSGEIRTTIFSDQFNKYNDLIKVDGVYLISKYRLQLAKPQFNKTNHNYEILFNDWTIVKSCLDDGEIPRLSLDLVPISDVKYLEKARVINVIGVCRNVGELKTVGSNTKLRVITLIDSSGFINLDLWGEVAFNFSINGDDHPVLLARESRINEFLGGKSIGMNINDNLQKNPDIPEAHKLREWFLNGGADNVTNNVSARTSGAAWTDLVTFQDVYNRGLGSGNNPDYFQCKAVVRTIKPSILYKACPQMECNLKVVDDGNGQYRCERCNAAYPSFKYRMLIKMEIRDFTFARWVTCFNNICEQLLKTTAQKVGEAVENGTTTVEEILSDFICLSYFFNIRCKNETYEGITRNNLTVESISAINYKEYNKHLIQELKIMTGISAF